jgi:uncharacterized OB-fold protein
LTSERLLPEPDEQSAAFWSAAADHVLTLAQCSACGSMSLPPGVVCGHCGSTKPDFRFVPVSGDGTVRSWTVVRQAFLPGFEDDLPFLLVDVELTEHPDVRLIGRLLDGPDAPPDLGARVALAFEDLTAEVAVPAFRLAP